MKLIKEYIALLTILLFIQTSFSQESKITLGVVGSFDVYSVKYLPLFPGINEDVEYESLNGFSVGGRFEYSFSKKFTLRTGLLYSSKGYTVNYNYRFIQPNDPSIPKSTIFKVGMFNLPILLGYEVVSAKKFKIIPALGMVVYGKIHESEVTIYEDDSERKSELPELYVPVLSSSQFSFQANLGFSYFFTDKVFVLFEPFFNYGFSGLNPTIEDGNPIMHGGILSVNFKL